MAFSKNYLFKYGWKEGEGLGKNNDGLKTAIKPKLKFDKAGIGFNQSLEFCDHWWKDVYSDALNSITSIKEEDVNLLKSKELDEERSIENYNVKTRRKKSKLESKDLDELFVACNGRTAHKGARHGLQLSGKLLRLQQQEQTLILSKADNLISGKGSEESLELGHQLKDSDFVINKSERINKKKSKRRKLPSDHEETICSKEDSVCSDFVCKSKQKKTKAKV